MIECIWLVFVICTAQLLYALNILRTSKVGPFEWEAVRDALAISQIAFPLFIVSLLSLVIYYIWG
jgi:hypothetical protein